MVCDASALVALLLDGGPDGRWAGTTLSGAALAGTVSADSAAQAHTDLLELPIELWPYDLLAPRVSELRRSLTSYDASYVAVAELLDAPLVTLDRRLSRAPGLQCRVITP